MTEYDPQVEQCLMEIAFGEVSETSRAIFIKLGREYADGDIVFREGAHCTELFIILSGEVVISQCGSDGLEQQLACLGSGEILGEMSHFDDLPRSATARARGTTRMLAFDRDNFSLIFQLHPKWTVQLVEGLSVRIRRAIVPVPSSGEH